MDGKGEGSRERERGGKGHWTGKRGIGRERGVGAGRERGGSGKRENGVERGLRGGKGEGCGRGGDGARERVGRSPYALHPFIVN